ncbi:MAG: helix-turn-helix domain-containing protein [Mycoplasmataceae bacterium]|jgi:transcriptional regulator with XRE-family HTH domain|nr:helix-turn-helix domain-containing protein [Mycoplasmataceae bacterium]
MAYKISKKINVIIGNNIRMHRERQGYTQDEFAFQCGISRAYYGRIERGEHSITIETLKNISDQINVKMSKLVEENFLHKYR